jgi:hypothetical protein
MIDSAPKPLCKRLLFVLMGSADWPEDFISGIDNAFGSVDFRGPLLPFEVTDYYAPEFGATLFRAVLSFRGLHDPSRLGQWKREAVDLEGFWARDGRRTRNLDIGYMDPDKVVLGSYKRGPCKLYLGDGVYADLSLKYAKGEFTPFPWAFADLRDGRYGKSLMTIREKMKAEMRAISKNPPILVQPPEPNSEPNTESTSELGLPQ